MQSFLALKGSSAASVSGVPLRSCVRGPATVSSP
jgi:hypothetical protein